MLVLSQFRSQFPRYLSTPIIIDNHALSLHHNVIVIAVIITSHPCFLHTRILTFSESFYTLEVRDSKEINVPIAYYFLSQRQVHL